ncbi:hypothetical protein GCM10009682_47240 [Luedemannella flava]|uniref:DUF2637 domain-containing protein n=1 Tax=Luedemannella flava TaxID=349316 RepID=A0ABP4YLG5_9ACTN
MNGVRLACNLSAGVVAGIAAWSSYSHMVGVALHYGERPEVAYVLPASVDGMLIVASVAMADDKRAGRRVRWSARLAFVVGVAASLAANVAHAQDTLGARIVSAWPAVALLLVVEILSRAGKRITQTAEVIETVTVTASDAPTAQPAIAPAQQEVKPAPAKRATPKRQPSAADRVAAAVARSPHASDATIAGRTGLSEATVKRHRRQAVDSVSTPQPAPEPVLEAVAA